MSNLKPGQKIFARRDSATAELRKIGVPKEHYHKFIEAVEIDGVTKFVCDAGRAKMATIDAANHVRGKTGDKVISDRLASHSTRSLEEAKSKISRLAVKKGARSTEFGSQNLTTLSGYCRDAIMKGKTNTQIIDELRVKFNLDPKRYHYPSWYRSQLKKQLGAENVPGPDGKMPTPTK